MDSKSEKRRVVRSRLGQGSKLAFTPYVALTLLLFTSISAQAAGMPPSEPLSRPAGLLSQLLSGAARLAAPPSAASLDKPGCAGLPALAWHLEFTALTALTVDPVPDDHGAAGSPAPPPAAASPAASPALVRGP